MTYQERDVESLGAVLARHPNMLAMHHRLGLEQLGLRDWLAVSLLLLEAPSNYDLAGLGCDGVHSGVQAATAAKSLAAAIELGAQIPEALQVAEKHFWAGSRLLNLAFSGKVGPLRCSMALFLEFLGPDEAAKRLRILSGLLDSTSMVG